MVQLCGRTISRVSRMRLTIEQRIAAMERDNVVLQDTIKLLHKLLKEDRALIHEYITHSVTAANANAGHAGDVRPEDALYTFVCKRRFDALCKEVEALRKRVDKGKPGLKAG